MKYSLAFITTLIIGMFPTISVAATEVNYLVQWRDDCVKSAEIDIIGQDLTSTITKVSLRDLLRVQQSVCVDSIEKDQKIRIATNDTNYGSQWYLENTGQSIGGVSGTPGVDIGFVSAYPSISGTLQGNTVVAVVDTGVSPISELSGKLQTGFNTISETTNTIDDNGHGTFISSLIAAQVNNGALIAGVNDRVNILPVKVLDMNGEGYLSDLIQGIQFAINQGADIINLSLVTTYTTSLNSVIEQAHNQGIIVIAASGNEGKDISTTKVSPINNDGNADWVIGVGAHTNQGGQASFSNYGVGIDILAPGDEIIGIMPNGSTTFRSGTSAAAGIATGIIAGWRDFYGTLSPSTAHILLDQYSNSGRISFVKGLVPQDHPDGMLIKTSSSGVYLISGGTKRPIVSPEVFLSHGFRWNDIVTVGTYEFNSIPEASYLPLREGTLIKDASTVYVVENDTKRPIASPNVFMGRGYKWENIWTMPSFIMQGIPTGSLLSSIEGAPLDGSLVFAEGTGVYLIQDSQKRPIPDVYTYLSQFNWSALIKINSSTLASIPLGSQLIPREGNIYADNSTVYYVEGNRKRPFASPFAYLRRGFTWDRLIKVPDGSFHYLSTGSVLQ